MPLTASMSSDLACGERKHVDGVVIFSKIEIPSLSFPKLIAYITLHLLLRISPAISLMTPRPPTIVARQ